MMMILLGVFPALVMAAISPVLAILLPLRIEQADEAYHGTAPLPPFKASWQQARAAVQLRSFETGLLVAFPFLALGLGLASGALSPVAAAFLLLADGLFLMIVIDGRTHLLPDALTFSFAALGVLVSYASAPNMFGVVSALLSAATAYGFLRLVSWIFERRRGEQGLGLGDIKLVAMLCIWFGLTATLLSFFIACLLAILQKVTLWAVRRSSWQQAFPFGPAIGGAALLMLCVYATPSGCQVMAKSDLLTAATKAFCSR